MTVNEEMLAGYADNPDARQFWNFEVSLAALTSLLFIEIQWNGFAFQGGCYPWHGAQFNVQSDGNKSIKQLYKRQKC